jgi:amino acid adenylation domain-containing protein
MQSALIFEGIGSGKPWINLEQVTVMLDGGQISAEDLRVAWQTVAERHGSLRLVLDWRASPAVQRCLPAITPPLTVLDCSDCTVAQRTARLAEFLETDRTSGTELSETPGWRVTVLQFAANSAVMVWTVHHALVDGRSMAQIVGEVLTLCAGGTLPESGAGAGTFRQFAETVALQQEQQAAATFFGDYLADLGDAGTLHLPHAAQADPEAQRKQRVAAIVPADLCAALEAQAVRMQATLASVIKTGWGIVLARWGGCSDIIFGSVRSGRHGAGGATGCLINTLPLRLHMRPDRTLEASVSALREATLAMHPFEQTSPAALRRASGLDGRQSLFTSIVMFERSDLQGLVHRQWPAARAHRITLHEEGGAPLSLSVYADAESDAAMRITLEHDPAMIPGAQAQLLLAHLLTLLDSIAVAAPDTLTGLLSMMDPHEVTQLLTLGTPDTPLDPTGECLVRGFRDAVNRSPDAVAIVDAQTDQTKSYAALDHWANGIAAQLLRAGIGAGDVVAIQLPRGAAFIAGLIGVLKCGAVFVPVDPSYPQAVQAHMLADSGAKLIVCGRADTARDSAIPDLIEVDPAAAPSQPLPPPLPTIDTAALAYILYTSGSTGAPKGVGVTRGNLLSHIAATRAAYGLSPADRVLQFASLSFDVALEELFPTLMAGGTSVLRDEGMAQSASSFLERAAQLRITISHLPTAFWHVLTDHLGAKGATVPPSLRLLVVGGEQAKARSLAVWRAAAPGVRWLNGYGPTETTITCTLFEPQAGQEYADVPIGRPLAHARTYVLATDHSLAPPGAAGLLAIGGPAVTRGYIGQDDATAATFLADPFIPGARLYLSGDRAQWRKDGNLAFLGREDRQIKLRGFRIDLRQIERALESAVPGLRALASVVEASTRAARLVTWVSGANLPSGTELSTVAARVLPQHMQPLLVPVDEFPQTAGGKIDMAALPHPWTASAPQSAAAVRPAGTLTPEIAAIMAQLLGVPQVGPDQNFYDLGGHSLLMMELIGQLEALGGLRLGLADFHDNPTPRQLARVLRKGSTAPRHIIPIQPQGTRAPLFAVHILGANEEYFRPLAKHLGADQPVLGVSINALGKDMPTGVAYTAGRYCEDINDAYPDGRINLIAVSLGSYMAFELAQQLHAAGRDVGVLAIIDAAGPAGRAEVSGLQRIAAHLRRARYLGRDYPRQMIHNRIYDLRIARAARILHRAAAEGGVLPPANFAQFDAANEAAVNDYTPEAIDVPLTIFRARSHFFDTQAGIEAGLGWADVARGGFEVIDVPGGHLSMLQEPHVLTVAAKLRARLDR